MRIACWIPKATNADSEYIILIAFALRRITAAEMKYVRRTAGYTWTDHKTNTQIAKELKNKTNSE